MPETVGVFYSGGEQWISPSWLLFGFVFEHRRKVNCVDHNQRMYVCIYTYFQVLIRQCHPTVVGNSSCLCYSKWPRESPSGPGYKIIEPVWHQGGKEPSLQACLGSGIRTTSRRGGDQEDGWGSPTFLARQKTQPGVSRHISQSFEVGPGVLHGCHHFSAFGSCQKASFSLAWCGK